MGFDEDYSPIDWWQCLMQHDDFVKFKYCIIKKETDRRHSRMKLIDIRLQEPPEVKTIGSFDTSIDPDVLEKISRRRL